MKKLLFTLIAIFTITATTFAQDATTIATAATKSELAKSKVSGEYTYVLPSTVTAEQVKKSSSYYTTYFTVVFDESTHNANVKMNEETMKSRMVMGRFLRSCGVLNVKVEKEILTLDVFMQTYLK